MKRQFCDGDLEHMWQRQTGTKTWHCVACYGTTTAENPCIRCGAEIGKAGSNVWCRDCLNGLTEERRVEDKRFDAQQRALRQRRNEDS